MTSKKYASIIQARMVLRKEKISAIGGKLREVKEIWDGVGKNGPAENNSGTGQTGS